MFQSKQKRCKFVQARLESEFVGDLICFIVCLERGSNRSGKGNGYWCNIWVPQGKFLDTLITAHLCRSLHEIFLWRWKRYCIWSMCTHLWRVGLSNQIVKQFWDLSHLYCFGGNNIFADMSDCVQIVTKEIPIEIEKVVLSIQFHFNIFS